MSLYAPIKPARLLWKDGEPFCEDFGDIYFSRGDGLPESRYVFLGKNDLPERWKGGQRFVVGETGFGTGLNFLALCQAWKAHRPEGGRLHFLSVERFPLSVQDLKQALDRWPELAEEAEALLAVYPPLLPGPHRVRLGHGITLDLWFGDALTLMSQWDAKVDAWFLDGFDPASNPQMWSQELFQQIARCTAEQGTFATFTVAGHVRRAAEAAGFAIEKVPGHGRKRQMLRGELRDIPASERAPWYRPAAPISPKHVAIVGGGIAGATCAWSLRQRGIKVTLLEADRLACGASGNPAAVVSPAPVSGEGPYAGFFRDAFVHAVGELNNGSWPKGMWNPVGLLQMAGRETRRKRLLVAADGLGLAPDWGEWLGQEGLSEKAGCPLPDSGLWLPQAGWLRPQIAIHALLGGGVRVLEQWPVQGMQRTGDQWLLHSDQKLSVSADAVILAGGMQMQHVQETAWLPLEPARGQISVIQGVPTLESARCVVCHEGYSIALPEEGVLIGASYVRGDEDTQCRQEEDQQNVRTLQRNWPQALLDTAPTIRASRAAIRATTPDRLPMIGACPDKSWSDLAYERLHQGPRAGPWADMQHHSGLYVATGYGSRGLTGSWLGAEILVSRMLGEPIPASREIVEALDPARFIYRALKRPPSHRPGSDDPG